MKSFKAISPAILFIALLISQTINFGISEPNSSSKGNDGWEYYSLSETSKGTPLKILATSSIIKNKDIETFNRYLTCKLKDGSKITLIDGDGDKQYNNFGVDIMVLGDSHYGIPLSKIINLNNKLYELNIIENNKMGLKLYEGNTGKVDLISKYAGSVPLNLIVVTSSKDVFFNVANNKSFVLPCATYSLFLGYVEEKGVHAAIKGDKMDKIEVIPADEDNKEPTPPVVLKWGSPLRFDFEVSVTKSKDKKESNKITVLGNSLKVLGSANEEYFSFEPVLAPAVEIKDSQQKTVGKGSLCPT